MQQNPMEVLMQMISMGNNPQKITEQILYQNPQVRTVFNQMQQSGLSPQQFVFQYAKQNNINIQPLINMLNQKGIKL